jgi:protein-tyrosine phosphatase
MNSVSRQLLNTRQQTRLIEFSADASVDIHCHCLPGLDDGPASMEQSLELCRALADDGITHVVATPHQLGSYAGANERTVVLESLEALREQLISHKIPLTVEAGADVRMDEQILELLESNQVLTLCDSHSAMLLEFPHDTLLHPVELLKMLADRGIRGIITHPERHPVIARHPQVVVSWVEAGALLQITSGSLTGDFGPDAQDTGWRLIEAGAVALIASDAHDHQNRPPRMTAAIKAISARLGHAVARRLCIENPYRIYTRQQVQSTRISQRFSGGAGGGFGRGAGGAA